MRQDYRGSKEINGAGFLVFAFIVSCFIFGGMFVYEKVLSPEVKSNNVENKNDKETENVSEEEYIDINSPEVLSAYGTIPCYTGFNESPSAYQSEKMSVSNLSHEYLRAFAFVKLDIDSIPKEPMCDADEGCIDDDWYYFEPKILQDKMKELYNTEIENGYFSVDAAVSVNYENGKYGHGVGGMTEMYSKDVRQIDLAYTLNDELIIEDKFLYVLYGKMEDDNNYGVEIYESSDKKTKILDEKADESIIDSAKLNTVVNKVITRMKKYKHTFKKNESGNYYWVSTEPIE